MHLRKEMIRVIVFPLSILIFVIGACCAIPTGTANNDGIKALVRFIDVGHGDVTLFKFPDGKSLLIDSGDGSKLSKERLTDALADFSVERIDYFVISNVNMHNIGNALYIAERYEVVNAFIPLIINPAAFPVFNSTIEKLEEKGTILSTSEIFCSISGDNYSVTFLSPTPISDSNSPYNKFNFAQEPTSLHINNLSPIIYVNIFERRFLLMGDADGTQETALLERYSAGSYFNVGGCGNKGVNLEDVDFYKVANHGNKNSNLEETLSLIDCVNAIIPVGGDNPYDYPHTEFLTRITKISPTATLFRTDRDASITIKFKGFSYDIQLGN